MRPITKKGIPTPEEISTAIAYSLQRRPIHNSCSQARFACRRRFCAAMAACKQVYKQDARRVNKRKRRVNKRKRRLYSKTSTFFQPLFVERLSSFSRIGTVQRLTQPNHPRKAWRIFQTPLHPAPPNRPPAHKGQRSRSGAG